MSADAFHALHHADRPLLLPNAWDYASAAALAAAGFTAIGTTSLGVAAAHGLPDAQGLAREETLALARGLSRLPCHVTVDIEAGFSEQPARVAELAAALGAAGAAGVNIEDGRQDGTLAAPAVQQELISAVKARAPELFVNARIDTHWLARGNPPPLGPALARAEAYIEAGADGIFVPALSADADIRSLVTGLGVPINILYQPGVHTLGRLAELGVARISTGSLLFRVSLQAAVDVALAIRDGGPVRNDAFSYPDIERLIGDGSHAHLAPLRAED